VDMTSRTCSEFEGTAMQECSGLVSAIPCFSSGFRKRGSSMPAMQECSGLVSAMPRFSSGFRKRGYSKRAIQQSSGLVSAITRVSSCFRNVVQSMLLDALALA